MYHYIYVLPEHPMKRSAEDFQYLSVKKIDKYKLLDFKVGEKIFLMYRKSKENAPGIIGYCYVAGQPIRVRDIPKEKRHLCYNRTLKQLPVKDVACGTRNIISEEILYSLPSFNEYGKDRVFSECSIIVDTWTFRLEKSILQRAKYWYIWRSQRSKNEVENYNQLYIHEQREKYATYHEKYSRLSKGVTKCSHCEVTHDEYLPYTLPFFEFHEKNTPKISKKYQKIDYSNFIALCPNCHKITHEQMVQNSFTDKECDYQGFDYSGLCLSWYECQ